MKTFYFYVGYKLPYEIFLLMTYLKNYLIFVCKIFIVDTHLLTILKKRKIYEDNPRALNFENLLRKT